MKHCDDCLFYEEAPRDPLSWGPHKFCRIFQVELDISRQKCRGRHWRSFDQHVKDLTGYDLRKPLL